MDYLYCCTWLSNLFSFSLPTIETAWKPPCGVKTAGVSLATGQQPSSAACLLEACCYDRLQMLQSICPAAAAATIILGRQIPDMRRRSDSKSTSADDALTPALFTVSADAWCPRALALLDANLNALIFGESRVAKTPGDAITVSDDYAHVWWLIKRSNHCHCLIVSTTMLSCPQESVWDAGCNLEEPGLNLFEFKCVSS